MRIHAEAERGQCIQRGRLSGSKVFTLYQQEIGKENETPVGDNAGLQRAQGAGG